MVGGTSIRGGVAGHRCCEGGNEKNSSWRLAWGGAERAQGVRGETNNTKDG